MIEMFFQKYKNIIMNVGFQPVKFVFVARNSY